MKSTAGWYIIVSDEMPLGIPVFPRCQDWTQSTPNIEQAVFYLNNFCKYMLQNSDHFYDKKAYAV